MYNPDIVSAHASLRLHNRDLSKMVLDMHLQEQARSLSDFSIHETEKYTKDISRSISYLEEAILAESYQVFSSHIAWSNSVLKSRKEPTEDLYKFINYINEACRKLLPLNDSNMIAGLIFKSIESASSCPQTTTYFEPHRPLAAHAQKYFALLLDGERKTAFNLIHELLQKGISIPDVYENIFQVSQYEVGRLWETNQITVAQEHFCTASTQSMMASLYKYIFTAEQKKGVVVGCSIDDELHELGIRMITDLFEMDGWDTYYLGANMPAKSIVEAIRERAARIIAISVTMPLHICKVRDLVHMIRNEKDLKSVEIMVGGAAFYDAPDLWMSIGADATAANARDAIAWANKQIK